MKEERDEERQKKSQRHRESYTETYKMSKKERERIRHLTLGEKGEKELTYEREEA